MISPIELAKDVLKRIDEYDNWREVVNKLPEDVRKAFCKLHTESLFDPKNIIKDSIKEYLSPSGKYKLVVCSLYTGKGTWKFTQGTVYHKDSDDPIAVIKRNYSSFVFSWIEDHPNSHDYLIGGEDYQGQTVIELDTGKKQDTLSEWANKGFGFCWVHHKFDHQSMILTVNGCVWGGPYEYRFYDFSDPMSGWPELDFDDNFEKGYISDDGRWPEFESKDILKCFQTREPTEEEDDDNFDESTLPLASIITFKREGNILIFKEEWVSDDEVKAREEARIAREKYKKEVEEFKANDPLYLAFIKELEAPELSQEEYLWRGFTHDKWCSEWQGSEGRWGKNVIVRDDLKILIEWGIKTGPVQVTIYKENESSKKVFLEHSVDSIKAAFAYAKEVANEINH